MAVAALIALLLLGICGNFRQTLREAYTTEVFLGILVGLALVTWLAGRPASPLDNWLGNLSYGVFPCHNLVPAIFSKTYPGQGRLTAFFWTGLGSVICAALAYYGVERPFVAMRHALRRRTGAA